MDKTTQGKNTAQEEQRVLDGIQKLIGGASDEIIRQARDMLVAKTEPQPLLRTAKASVFTDLFSEKEYQKELYKSLTGEERSEDEFRTITLENHLIGEIHNDLGFLVGDEIVVLCEAQTTWNVNIVYRMLCYLVLGWRRLAHEKGWNAFSREPIPLPEPRLYVIYTGKEKAPGELKLSDQIRGASPRIHSWGLAAIFI